MKRYLWGAAALAVVLAGVGCGSSSSGGGGTTGGPIPIVGTFPITLTTTASGNAVLVQAVPQGFTPDRIHVVGYDTTTLSSPINADLQPNGANWTGVLQGLLTNAGDNFAISATAYIGGAQDGTGCFPVGFCGGTTGGTTGATTANGTTTNGTTTNGTTTNGTTTNGTTTNGTTTNGTTTSSTNGPPPPPF